MIKNGIYNCDCIDGLKLIDDNSIDLIVTSPPYNCGIDYDVWDDQKMSYTEYLHWCREWLKECYRVLKDDGRICIDHYLAYAPKEPDGKHKAQFPMFDFKNMMDAIGFHSHKVVLWDDQTVVKQTAWGSWLSASAPNILTPYEGILIAYKNQWKKLSSGKSTIGKETFMECCKGIWHIGTTRSATKACFPEKLPYMCIQLLTYEGDTVLDPFSGSGTTCFVAKGLNRNYIGFELSKDYTEYSLNRLKNKEFVDKWKDKG